MRPIVSGRDSICYETSKEVVRILQPVVGNTHHHIKDSVDLVAKLKDKVIPPGFSIVSFDVKDMYTTTPQEAALALAEEKLRADSQLSRRTPIRGEHIMAMLTCDLNLAYFRWDGEFYAQRRGLGMGKSTSSPLSDIFMEDFEGKALTQYQTGDPSITPHDVILFWFRKADDTVTAIRNDHIDPFFTFLNSLHPSIQWTMEREKDGRLPMLDVLIEKKEDGSLEFDVYRKPTHTNQYIDFASHQPLSHKLSTIHSLVVQH